MVFANTPSEIFQFSKNPSEINGVFSTPLEILLDKAPI